MASIHNEDGESVRYILIRTGKKLLSVEIGRELERREFLPSAHYLLWSDIDLTESFGPLPEFSGLFAGDYHTIKNLRIESTSSDSPTGLFTQISADGLWLKRNPAQFLRGSDLSPELH